MFELNINGKTVYSETDKTLLSFLRDDECTAPCSTYGMVYKETC